MNEKLTFIYPQYEFNDTAATLLFKKNSDYYYDKEMTKKINKSDMFDLFVNGNLLAVDSNGKYTKVASCTEDGTIKEAGASGSGAVDPADIAEAVDNYFEEHPVSENNIMIMPKYDTPQEMRSSGVIDKPIAVLTFDGWDENTIEKIAPYLYEKGIPFTVFAGFNDSKIGSADFMTNSRLQAYHTLKDYGGEVQFYTSQPKTTFEGTDNYIEQYNQLMQAYNRFLSWGFGKPKHCALAGGVTSDILNSLLHELNIKSARTTTNHDNVTTELFEYPSIYCTNKTFHNFPQTLNGWANVNIPTFGMAHGLINDTLWKDENTFISEANMKAMIDDLATLKTTKNVTFMTYSEFWDYIHFPKNAEIGQHCLIWEGDEKQHEYVKTATGWYEVNSQTISTVTSLDSTDPTDIDFTDIEGV